MKRVEVTLSEHAWSRISAGGKPHAHAFQAKGGGRPLAKIVSTAEGTGIESGIESGIEDLLILKTTASAFKNFVRDKLTTLPETDDRIFATNLRAVWTYKTRPAGYAMANKKVLDALLKVFAKNFSPSVQATLFQMGTAALKAVPEISKISIVLPNRHCLLINLKPFGLANKNELFIPTDEPHGQIEGTVARDDG